MNKLKLIISMIIFGTLGIFIERISYPSAFIALFRAVCGFAVLVLYALFTGKKISIKNILSNIVFILPSGLFLGFNWVFLFQAYRYTSISFATLCYYMAPIFVILLTPIFFSKRSSTVKNACAVVAVAGMVLVTGVQSFGHYMGLVFGLSAALFYSLIIILNSKAKGISAIELTVFQLGVSALVLLPYVLARYDLQSFSFDRNSVVILLILGIVHTGIAYMLYFGSVNKLAPQTVAVYSYIDPIVAIVLSAIMSRTMLSLPEIVGAIMILGAAAVSDLKN